MNRRWAVVGAAAAARTLTLAAAAVLPTLTVPARAGAALPHTVVVFTPQAGDPLVARLDAELRAVGISVRHLAPPPGADIDALASAAIAGGAGAAIRVLPASAGTEVWTAEASARVRRRQSISADRSDAALSLIALRTVELVRASLLELGKRPPQTGATPAAPGARASGSDGETPKPPTADRAGSPPAPATSGATTSPRSPADAGDGRSKPAAESTPPRTARPETAAVEPDGGPTVTDGDGGPPALPRDDGNAGRDETGVRAKTILGGDGTERTELVLGPALLASAGGVPVLLGLGIAGRVRVTRRAGVELTAVVPLSVAQVSNLDGAAGLRLNVGVLAVGGYYRLFHDGRLGADGAAGLAALMLRAAGVDSSQVTGSSDSSWGAAVVARLGGSVFLGRWFSLRLDVIGGAAFWRPVVAIAAADGSTHDLVSWGRPFLAGLAGIAAAF